ncbi:hypothetical protein HOF65_00115 [bacterium]|nr:hypothetical protein [bacterium]MBT3852454.1 hypothetical protein [bacterium]MBT4632794.1 hypothetical protein [bacterium]MBT6779095.1 hypothetical protein [bacterium]
MFSVFSQIVVSKSLREILYSVNGFKGNFSIHFLEYRTISPISNSSSGVIVIKSLSLFFASILLIKNSSLSSSQISV